MKKARLAGLAAAAGALIVGAVALSTSVFAAGTGPEIQASGPAVALVGTNFNLNFATDGSAVDAYSGFNLSVVYDESVVTVNSVTDQSAGPLFGGNFCPPASLANDFGGLLPAPQKAFILGCTSLSAPTTTTAGGPLATANITANAITAPVTAFHMVSAGAPDNGGGSFGTYTINAADSSIQDNVLACTAPVCGPLPIPGSAAHDVVVAIINPPPDLALTKTASPTSIVAGQPVSFTLSVNNPSGTTDATNVVITDTLPSAFPGANVTFSGTNAGDCGIAGQVVTCGPTTIPALGTWTATIDVSATDVNAGGTSPVNSATVTLAEADPNLANNTGNATVQIIAPAVVWEKTPNLAQAFLTTGSASFTFAEVMVNQGDPNGLGGFSFDVVYDSNIWQHPTYDFSPAIALFAAAGRTLDCSVTILGNGLDHIACASTGTYGVGPIWTGAQDMVLVTLEPLEIVTEQIRPNKENGIVTWVKDKNVIVTNTCGQPLNDGSSEPIPGQPECQGELLQGVGPGGVLNESRTVITVRRLEGDVVADCAVDVSDMQAEASRFGTSLGSLLYNLWYDVNSPLKNGDAQIDINDIQFVYGRFGSTCTTPIPPQPAQNLP